MVVQEMMATIEKLVIKGKGILAADESLGTIGKRFKTINVENSEENRRKYRSLLCTTDDIEKYISGVILFEETLSNKTDNGVLLTNILTNKNIVPGIKVDLGLTTITAQTEEKITQGLDGLIDRLKIYKEQGAWFAKWRNVYSIQAGQQLPTKAGMLVNAHVLARYAAICQSVGIVPIVEPELLMDGNHSIEQCAITCEMILNTVFNALKEQNVILEYIILKPNMILPGTEFATESNIQSNTQTDSLQVAKKTIQVLRRTVPAAVPSINFLSGGQTAKQATINLNAINSLGQQPWQLSFSYGRALQEDCLHAWQGQDQNVKAAQQAVLLRAKLNSLASLGKYQQEQQ